MLDPMSINRSENSLRVKLSSSIHRSSRRILASMGMKSSNRIHHSLDSHSLKMFGLQFVCVKMLVLLLARF